ncbi:MAG: hypothetical protein SFV22_01330 [Saprospiraceae bacterium]|nr:hypothetical protein [Saprospiraceae bacterium]
MKYEEIQALLDRYWEGETSLEEERQIRAYFNSGIHDERLARFVPLFRAIREEQELQLKTVAKAAPMRPQLYQWAVAASIALVVVAGWWWLRDQSPANEVIANVAPANESPQPEAPVARAEITQQVVVAAAEQPRRSKSQKAAKKSQKTMDSREIDPETAKAMAEIKAALALVSAKLDKGRNEAVKSAGHLEALDKVPKREDG